MLTLDFFRTLSYKTDESTSDFPQETLENGIHTFNYIDCESFVEAQNSDQEIKQITVNYNDIDIENIHFISCQVDEDTTEKNIIYFTYQKSVYLLHITDNLNGFFTEAVKGESLEIIQEKIMPYDSDTANTLTPFIEKIRLDTPYEEKLSNNKKLKL